MLGGSGEEIVAGVYVETMPWQPCSSCGLLPHSLASPADSAVEVELERQSAAGDGNVLRQYGEIQAPSRIIRRTSGCAADADSTSPCLTEIFSAVITRLAIKSSAGREELTATTFSSAELCDVRCSRGSLPAKNIPRLKISPGNAGQNR